MNLDFACFNADWTRRPSVNTQSKLTEVLSKYIADDMVVPAAVTLSEVNARTARETARLAGDAYDFVNEKVGYDHLALLWDSTRLEKTGAHVVSTIGKYIAVPFRVCDTDDNIVLASAHLPRKRATRGVGGSVLDRAHAMLDAAVNRMLDDTRGVASVIKGDLNTPPDRLAELYPDYELAFTNGDTTTCNRTCPDNVMVWINDDAADFVSQVFADCRHFDHYPLWVQVN
jgi:hypothetical protein